MSSNVSDRRTKSSVYRMTQRRMVEGATATPLVIRSSQVSLLARAGGYVSLGESTEEVPAGTDVDVRLLEGTL